MNRVYHQIRIATQALLFILIASNAYSQEISKEDFSLFKLCASTYLNSRNAISTIDIRYRTCRAEKKLLDEVQRGDFSQLKWTDEYRHLRDQGVTRTEHHQKRNNSNRSDFVKRFQIISNDGYLSYEEGDSFVDFKIIPVDLEIEAVSDLLNPYEDLADILTEGIEGKLSVARLDDANGHPVFLLEDCITVEFDTQNGYLPVYIKHGPCDEQDGVYFEYIVLEKRQIEKGIWFPVKFYELMKNQRSPFSVQISPFEILDIEVNHHVDTDELSITFSDTTTLSVGDSDVILPAGAIIRSTDFFDLQLLPLKEDLNSLIRAEPGRVPAFLWQHPSLAWHYLPNIIFTILAITCLVSMIYLLRRRKRNLE